jgi:hypothetical protein
MKIARANKLLLIQDGNICLESRIQDSLRVLKPDLPEFWFNQDYLLKLVLSENFKTCLDCMEIVSMEVKVTTPVSDFEYQMALRFI